MILIYFFLFHIYGINSKNLYINNKEPVDLDLGKTYSHSIKVTYSPSLKSAIYQIKNEDNDSARIGNVYEDGVLIYPDSDILIYRKVIELIDPGFDGTLVQINSTYDNGGKKVNELIEFVRTSPGAPFREVIRRPVLLDLKPGTRKITPIEIRFSHRFISNDELINYTREVIQYDIKPFERLSFILGPVKYGNILIDTDVYNITHKRVNVYRNESQELIVKIMKMVKNGNYVTTECLITLEDEEQSEGSCKQLTRKSVTLL